MPEPVRIVALDHFSGQDRKALIAAGGEAFAWRVIPYWRFRNRANKMFPAEVREGLEAWARPDLRAERIAYAAWCRREFARLYVEWPFDVVLLPSDTFYYVRAFPDICHELGVPLFVAQKETTITDYSMTDHAPSVRRHSPFVGDRMTVCSERHRQFWVAAGADASSIAVTGQPRFDIYAEAPTREGGERRTVLFLSYELDAYLLDTADRVIGWRDLRDATERVLIDATAQGWEVVVKLHPLQDWEAEERWLEAKAGGNPSISLAPADADTRKLILDADAVVGFQTTALYEAIAAGKPVAYTAWGAAYEQFRPLLIPFDERPDLLDVVRSSNALATWLRNPPLVDVALRGQRLAFVSEMLGPFDGQASLRTLDVIRAEVANWAERARTARRRRALDRVRMLAGPVLLIAAALPAAALRAAAVLPGRIGRGAAFHLTCRAERLAALRRAGKTVA